MTDQQTSTTVNAARSGNFDGNFDYNFDGNFDGAASTFLSVGDVHDCTSAGASSVFVDGTIGDSARTNPDTNISCKEAEEDRDHVHDGLVQNQSQIQNDQRIKIVANRNENDNEADVMRGMVAPW